MAAQRLRITVGAGITHSIDADVARTYRGAVGDVLRDIFDQQIHDPELRSMLDESDVVLEQYVQASDGSTQDAALSPAEDWSRIVQQLEQGDLELGMARNHEGGADPGKAVPAGQRTLSSRFRHQRAVGHSRDHVLTDADRAAIHQGRAFFITGRALAKVECVCEQLGSSEGIWYYIAPDDAPLVVTDLVIPGQQAYVAACAVDAAEVLRAARQARQNRQRIVAAGHSHGNSLTFTSGVDDGQMRQLAAECAGQVQPISVQATAVLRRIGGAQEGQQLEATFPGSCTTLSISSAIPLDPADLSVKLHFSQRRILSTFTTSNAHGEHLVPILETISCTACGGKTQRQLPVAGITVHVIGPVELSPAEEAALCREVRAKVRTGYTSYRYEKGSYSESYHPTSLGAVGSSQNAYPIVASAAASVIAGTLAVGSTLATTPPVKPRSYDLERNGRHVATIPAAVLEEAAAKCPGLAMAMGWVAPDGAAEASNEQHH